MGDLSPHFSWSEFADHRTGEKVVALELVQRLEALRAIVGHPLNIISGYRSVATNQAVGGAPDSQHLYGKAADLGEGQATVTQAIQAGFRGVGYCGQWATHVDVRLGPEVTFKDC